MRTEKKFTVKQIRYLAVLKTLIDKYHTEERTWELSTKNPTRNWNLNVTKNFINEILVRNSYELYDSNESELVNAEIEQTLLNNLSSVLTILIERLNISDKEVTEFFNFIND